MKPCACDNRGILKGLIAFIDTNDGEKHILRYEPITLITQGRWNRAVTSILETKDHGLTGSDVATEQRMFEEHTEFKERGTATILEKVGENDRRGEIIDTSYTVVTAIIDAIRVATLDDGYFSGYFGLEGFDYQTLPYRYPKGFTFETRIYLPDADFSKYAGNDGIFLFLGARAENKYYDLECDERHIYTDGDGYPLGPDHPDAPEKGVEGNAIAFTINEEGEIGYKYIDDSCAIREEYSCRPIVDEGWHNIAVTYRPYSEIKDLDLLDCEGRRLGELRVYLDGTLNWVVEDFPEPRFFAMKTEGEKQIGVPYTLSWGGGTFGLKHSWKYLRSDDYALRQYLVNALPEWPFSGASDYYRCRLTSDGKLAGYSFEKIRVAQQGSLLANAGKYTFRADHVYKATAYLEYSGMTLDEREVIENNITATLDGGESVLLSEDICDRNALEGPSEDPFTNSMDFLDDGVTIGQLQVFVDDESVYSGDTREFQYHELMSSPAATPYLRPALTRYRLDPVNGVDEEFCFEEKTMMPRAWWDFGWTGNTASGTYSLVEDRSGNGFHMEASGSPAGPAVSASSLNGYDIAVFDGNSGLFTSSAPDIDHDIVIAVVRQNQSLDDGVLLGSIADDDNPRGYGRARRGFSSDGNPLMSVRYGGELELAPYIEYVDTLETSGATGDWQIIMYINDMPAGVNIDNPEEFEHELRQMGIFSDNIRLGSKRPDLFEATGAFETYKTADNELISIGRGFSSSREDTFPMRLTMGFYTEDGLNTQATGTNYLIGDVAEVILLSSDDFPITETPLASLSKYYNYLSTKYGIGTDNRSIEELSIAESFGALFEPLSLPEQEYELQLPDVYYPNITDAPLIGYWQGGTNASLSGGPTNFVSDWNAIGQFDAIMTATYNDTPSTPGLAFVEGGRLVSNVSPTHRLFPRNAESLVSYPPIETGLTFLSAQRFNPGEAFPNDPLIDDGIYTLLRAGSIWVYIDASGVQNTINLNYREAGDCPKDITVTKDYNYENIATKIGIRAVYGEDGGIVVHYGDGERLILQESITQTGSTDFELTISGEMLDFMMFGGVLSDERYTEASQWISAKNSIADNDTYPLRGFLLEQYINDTKSRVSELLADDYSTEDTVNTFVDKSLARITELARLADLGYQEYLHKDELTGKIYPVSLYTRENFIEASGFSDSVFLFSPRLKGYRPAYPDIKLPPAAQTDGLVRYLDGDGTYREFEPLAHDGTVEFFLHIPDNCSEFDGSFRLDLEPEYMPTGTTLVIRDLRIEEIFYNYSCRPPYCSGMVEFPDECLDGREASERVCRNWYQKDCNAGGLKMEKHFDGNLKDASLHKLRIYERPLLKQELKANWRTDQQELGTYCNIKRNV